jgi:hypothetical protein
MRRFAHIVAPLAAFVATFAAGAWFSIERDAATSTERVDQRLAATASVASKTDPQIKQEFLSDEEVQTLVMSAVSEGNLIRLDEGLRRLGSAELGVLFEKMIRLEDRDRRSTFLRALLERWAIVDPAAAEAAVRPYLDRLRSNMLGGGQTLDAVICTAWAGVSPERVLAEAMAAPDSQWARTMAQAAIESLAHDDPVRRLELLTRFPASRLRDQMCETAIKALMQNDCAAAEAHLELLSEPRLRMRLRSEILGKLAEHDPAAALVRLAKFSPDLKPGPDGFQFVNTLVGAVAKKDPAAALEAVNELPEGLQKEALGAALDGWAREHPVDALTWAAANGIDPSEAESYVSYGANRGFGSRTLIAAAIETDRAQTLDWLRTQPASPARDEMLQYGIWTATVDEKLQIYAELTPRGKANAAANLVNSCFARGQEPRSGADRLEPWINTQPPGPARSAAIQAFASCQARTTQDVETLVNQWPAGPDRDAAFRGISSSLTNNDPKRALDFARRVSAPGTCEPIFERIAQNWLWRDEPNARAWITSTPELSAEQKRVVLRQFDER